MDNVKEERHDFQKFLALEPSKRERIINSAMTEFLNGYKIASTDAIVRDAGISKGLLFNYFGTKERLYDFLIEYASGILQAEYMSLDNVYQKDILDSIWKISLLRRDLSERFPAIFEFLTQAYIDKKESQNKAKLTRLRQMQEQMMRDIYDQCDLSLFRDDVDPQKAVDLIWWSVAGFAEAKAASNTGASLEDTVQKNFDSYLIELSDYLNIIRLCFYKP